MTAGYKHEIYVASSWRNTYQEGIVKLLREKGHTVYDFKNPAPGNTGFDWVTIGPLWQLWTPSEFRTGLSRPIAQESFNFDMTALESAEIVVLLLPSGRSSHLEAAYHKGRGRPVIVHMPEPCEPELMYKMFNVLTVNESELVTVLEGSIAELAKASE